MIRIRYPSGSPVPVWLLDLDGVEHTDDPTVIALEEEKNGPAQFADVERNLRPHYAAAWHGEGPLFRIVSVETRAGCNHECRFCPVSRSVDPRPPGELPFGVLQKIADELAELGYHDRILLFGNNEPLLDARMPQIVRLFRTSCPGADVRLLTNGTRATPQLLTHLFEAGLSTLVINNYTDGRRLIGPVRALLRTAAALRPFDIRISVRDREQVLTTRAGTAPNKPMAAAQPAGFCALPFTDIHISYTGTVNLCCFDAHGKVSMGDVGRSSLVQIWRSPAYDRHRRGLLSSIRKGLPLCEKCDFDGFRAPMTDRAQPMTRQDFTSDRGQPR